MGIIPAPIMELVAKDPLLHKERITASSDTQPAPGTDQI
jgi:hypothetical protein